MKIMTILGTRPEIIRLSLLIRKLDKASEHILVHTGQNYAECLSDLFFKELSVRTPDHSLEIKAPRFGEQAGRIVERTERVMLKERPERLVLLGDTNSALSALPAKRLGIGVFHLEAGNRCYDDRVPEEVNRRVIDHSSDVLMPYTRRSRENLAREGIPGERIFVIGNPIGEVLEHHRPSIDRSRVLARLGLKKKSYFLATMHRAENVDVRGRLENLVRALELVAEKYGKPVICSLHPRTKDRMEKWDIRPGEERVRFLTPLGFFDFIALEKNALCVLTDSGTVQEECCLFRIPNVTVRDSTERPETLECGSNILAGVDPGFIQESVGLALKEKRSWAPPAEYLDKDVSSKALKIILGHYGLQPWAADK